MIYDLDDLDDLYDLYDLDDLYDLSDQSEVCKSYTPKSNQLKRTTDKGNVTLCSTEHVPWERRRWRSLSYTTSNQASVNNPKTVLRC